MNNNYKDFGYINAWSQIPPTEVIKCKKKKHKLIIKKDDFFTCLTHYSCPKCKIKFRLDTSD